MKKLILFLILALTVFTLAACSDKDKDTDKGNPDSSGNQTETEGSADSGEDAPTETVKQPTEGISYKLSKDGAYAFVTNYSGADTEIIIADTYEGVPVRIIDCEAFYDNKSITSVTIPAGVTTVEYSAFEGCSKLSSITIPGTLTDIEDKFEGCVSLSSISVDESNPTYKSIDGNLYSKDGKALIRYAVGKAAKSFTVPDGVTTVSSGTFGSSLILEEVILPSSVTTIEDSAFESCSSLKSVTVPNSVTTIGHSAFRDCISLTSIAIPSSVTVIEDAEFSGCIRLESVTIPVGVTSIGGYAFGHCKSLTSVTVPDGVTVIEPATFSGCERLTSVTIPDSVKQIESGAFSNCSSLTNVTIGCNITDVVDIFDGCPKINYNTYGNGLYLGSSKNPYSLLVKAANKYIESCDIHENTKYINPTAFRGCGSLESITVPAGVTSIGSYAFENCQDLASVTIPVSVTSIGDRAFQGCDCIKNVYYTGSVEQWRSIYYPGLKIPGIATVHYNYSAIQPTEYIVYELSEDETYAIVTGYSGTAAELVIADTHEGVPVTAIGTYAFEGCASLMSIIIPYSVTDIDSSAFSYCTSLTDIYYTGSEEQWNSISKDNAEIPSTATVHYNYS